MTKIHLSFVVIHPYDNDNGWITRTLANYVLSKELGLNHKYFSISSAVIKDKKNYYAELEKTNKIMNNKDFDFTD